MSPWLNRLFRGRRRRRAQLAHEMTPVPKRTRILVRALSGRDHPGRHHGALPASDGDDPARLPRGDGLRGGDPRSVRLRGAQAFPGSGTRARSRRRGGGAGGRAAPLRGSETARRASRRGATGSPAGRPFPGFAGGIAERAHPAGPRRPRFGARSHPGVGADSRRDPGAGDGGPRRRRTSRGEKPRSREHPPRRRDHLHRRYLHARAPGHAGGAARRGTPGAARGSGTGRTRGCVRGTRSRLRSHRHRQRPRRGPRLGEPDADHHPEGRAHRGRPRAHHPPTGRRAGGPASRDAGAGRRAGHDRSSQAAGGARAARAGGGLPVRHVPAIGEPRGLARSSPQRRGHLARPPHAGVRGGGGARARFAPLRGSGADGGGGDRASAWARSWRWGWSWFSPRSSAR